MLFLSPFLEKEIYGNFSFNFESTNWSSYSPGLWEQDIFTLPLEGALTFMVSEYYAPRATPLWPFQQEGNGKSEHSSLLPSRKVAPPAILIGTGVLGGLSLWSASFKLYPHLRGWLHAILVTEIATVSAKVIFQRNRPFFDTKYSDHHLLVTDDNRFSFFSGHASHAFSFATYTSALMLTYCDPYISVPFSAAMYGLAGWVASTRVTGNQHHLDDVIMGGLAGTLITGLIFIRVEDVIQKHYRDIKIQARPSIEYFATANRLVPTLNVSIEF